jgi:hypothetical protein
VRIDVARNIIADVPTPARDPCMSSGLEMLRLKSCTVRYFF